MSKNYTTFLLLAVDQLEFSRLSNLFSQTNESYQLNNLSKCGLGNLFNNNLFLSKDTESTAFFLEEIARYSNPLEYYHHVLGNLNVQNNSKPGLLSTLKEKCTKTVAVSSYDLTNLGFECFKQISDYPKKIMAITHALDTAKMAEDQSRGTFIFSDIIYSSTIKNEIDNLKAINQDIGNLVSNLELGDIIMLIGNPTSKIYNGSNKVPLLALRKGFKKGLGWDIKILSNRTPATIGHIIAQEFRCEDSYIKQLGLENYFV